MSHREMLVWARLSHDLNALILRNTFFIYILIIIFTFNNLDIYNVLRLYIGLYTAYIIIFTHICIVLSLIIINYYC